MKRRLYRKVLILGSGGLKIGQAGEFDYSGSQAIKALKQEGIATVLVNPNIATVQTDSDMADKVYFQPLKADVVEKIIERERPDAIALSFGGQTALNLGLKLHERGVLAKNRVKILGSPINAIKTTEDRDLFKKALNKIKVKTPASRAVYSVNEALKAAKEIGYPVMMRSGFSLGGLGSGKVANADELKLRVGEALQAVSQVLIEEYLTGWKEIEYEVVRDGDGNCVTVCNMENFDPMGIHTGESIVVAPSQTLSNDEYHGLREIALKTIEHLGIIGECNIQYALSPKDGDYRVIEVNARLSRSSALASKATGYPLAFVAMKLALGYRLDELTNSVTGTTPAFYEPALDYLAVKIPRWDLSKLRSSDHRIGSEMKSVGEVMALGRSFPEALQKAVRMLNIGADGLSFHPHEFESPSREIGVATDRRLFAIYEVLKKGASVKNIQTASGINSWFLNHMKRIADFEKELKRSKLNRNNLRTAKQLGFSDSAIAKLKKIDEEAVRSKRLRWGIKPVVKQIDTLAGEAEAETNYLYMTYHGQESDVLPMAKPAIITLGSGPYSIGSSVEFDWSAVNTVKTLQANKLPTIIINSNPETVSTDYDHSDRLYFEQLTLERVRDIADFENYQGIVVSVGGQVANNLAMPLFKTGYKILGTSPLDIDRAENRQRFSQMLNDLHVDQPEWTEVTTLAKAHTFAKKVGYPVLVRPSYVLSGGAMSVVQNKKQLDGYLAKATKLSPDHPVVLSKFIEGAKELEIDGVGNKGKILIYTISEHIENAGVHSGDATVVLPAQKLYLETIRRTKRITKRIVRELKITGPFNIQFIARDNAIKVIECNVRASRSFPFVSKVTNFNFIQIATEAMLGIAKDREYQTLDLDYVAVKSPQFSYNRLKGADPVAGVEMASTGEVACLGDDLLEAFWASWQAAEQRVEGKSIFLSISEAHKAKLIDEVKLLYKKGWSFYTTRGTHRYLAEHGVKSKMLNKIATGIEPNVGSSIMKKQFQLAINIPTNQKDMSDGFQIRRLSVDNHLALVTNPNIAKDLMLSLINLQGHEPEPKSWQEYITLH